MEAGLEPWQAFWEALDRLSWSGCEAKRDFEGLMAVLYGKRPEPRRHPLCIDGREYHRRQRRRVKRKGRR